MLLLLVVLGFALDVADRIGGGGHASYRSPEQLARAKARIASGRSLMRPQGRNAPQTRPRASGVVAPQQEVPMRN